MWGIKPKWMVMPCKTNRMPIKFDFWWNSTGVKTRSEHFVFAHWYAAHKIRGRHQPVIEKFLVAQTCNVKRKLLCKLKTAYHMLETAKYIDMTLMIYAAQVDFEILTLNFASCCRCEITYWWRKYQNKCLTKLNRKISCSHHRTEFHSKVISKMLNKERNRTSNEIIIENDNIFYFAFKRQTFQHAFNDRILSRYIDGIF